MAKKKSDDKGYKPPKNLDELLVRAAEIDGGDEIQDFVDAAPTGISTFDTATGVGGLPLGRLSVFEGIEHGGKTLLLLTAIARAQRDGHTCAFIDGEHALTPQFARLLGVDWEKLKPWVRRPKTLDATYDLVKEFARSGMFRIVGYDSATALTTQEALETNAGDTGARAAIARMHSEELPKLTALQSQNTAVVFINQMRTNPNPPIWHKGGELLYSPGGKALKHYASLRFEIKAIGQPYKKGDQRIGHRLRAINKKNKVGIPYLEGEFDLMYAEGLDLTSDMIDNAIDMDVIHQAGSWFTFVVTDEDGIELEEKKFSGRVALEEAIKGDEWLRQFIEGRIKQANEES